MSPEQARGQDTDHRTDLFSFGVMMYQALTGRKPFEGDDYASVVSSILKDDPEPVTALKPVTPHTLWWTIQKCLEKNREHRIQTARELHKDLHRVQQEIQTGAMLIDVSHNARPLPFWRKPIEMLVVAAVGIMVGSPRLFAPKGPSGCGSSMSRL